MSHFLQKLNLIFKLLLREPSPFGLVLLMITTIKAGVYAIVRNIQRSKEHDPVAINFLLYLAGCFKDFVPQFVIRGL
jgi:hypothetical protein